MGWAPESVQLVQRSKTREQSHLYLHAPTAAALLSWEDGNYNYLTLVSRHASQAQLAQSPVSLVLYYRWFEAQPLLQHSRTTTGNPFVSSDTYSNNNASRSPLVGSDFTPTVIPIMHYR